jgi:hypothetical protein
MDASKITELRQKQQTRYVTNSQAMDSSTLTWISQIKSSQYIKGVKTCEGLQNPNNPVQNLSSNGQGSCYYGGGGKQTTLMMGSSQLVPNVLAGASGSASRVPTSDSITWQKAGKEICGTPTTDPYTVLPACYCTNSNVPPPLADGSIDPNYINNNVTNPYLPAFDTYYKFKNPLAQITTPIPDQNQKHFVKQCHSRFPNANGVSNQCYDCVNSPKTCDGCVLAP